MSAADITRDEHLERLRGLCDRLSERELAGALVWSRGGGASADFYGNVLYLIGLHNPVPVLSDNGDHWHGRGHAGLVVRADGQAVAVADYLPIGDEVAIEDLRETLDVPAGVAEAIRDLELVGEPLGLAAQDTLLRRDAGRIDHQLGATVDWVAIDELLDEMRRVKSPAELELMRTAAAAGVTWVDTMINAVEPGITEGDVVGQGLRALAALGGRPHDVAVGSGPRSSEYFYSQIPGWDTSRPFEDGDLFHVDAWGPVRGYFTDFTRCTVVGGDPSEAQSEVLEAPVALIEHLTEQVRPGLSVAELFQSSIAWLAESGLDTPPDTPDVAAYFASLFPAVGHGLGLGIERPWLSLGDDSVLEEGMVIAIETFLTSGPYGAGFEHNVVVGAEEPEILDRASEARPWTT